MREVEVARGSELGREKRGTMATLERSLSRMRSDGRSCDSIRLAR